MRKPAIAFACGLLSVAGLLLFGAPTAGDRLPGELRAAIVRDLHVTPDEYLAWADRAQRSRFESRATSMRFTQTVGNREGAYGGDAFITSTEPLTTNGKMTVCSFGLSALGADGTSYNISAGHCDPGKLPDGTGAPVYLPGTRPIEASQPIGKFVSSSVGTTAADLDYSAIKVGNDPSAAGLLQPVVRGPEGPIPVAGIAEPVPGAPVCKSGQTSGFTCGVILDPNVNAALSDEKGVERQVKGFSSSLCTLSGDSGGAIISGTMAVGIVSGSNSHSAFNCQIADLTKIFDGGTLSLGIPITPILADLAKTVGPLTLRTSATGLPEPATTRAAAPAR